MFVFVVNGSDYAYILGLYLGDGCLTGPKPGGQLRITLDLAYPGIIAECAEALERISPNKVSVAPDGRPDHNGVHVYSGWKLWALLFPQHGRGRKHERQIVLTQWQWELVRHHRELGIRTTQSNHRNISVSHRDSVAILERIVGPKF